VATLVARNADEAAMVFIAESAFGGNAELGVGMSVRLAGIWFQSP